MNNITIQQIELFIVKIFCNSKYLPYKKMKHAISLTSVTNVT